jgi:hypothetical protein
VTRFKCDAIQVSHDQRCVPEIPRRTDHVGAFFRHVALGLTLRSNRPAAREGDPKGWSTVLVIALGSWEKSVPRGQPLIGLKPRLWRRGGCARNRVGGRLVPQVHLPQAEAKESAHRVQVSLLSTPLCTLQLHSMVSIYQNITKHCYSLRTLRRCTRMHHNRTQRTTALAL